MMGDVYRLAEPVISWLGDEEGNIDLALDILSIIDKELGRLHGCQPSEFSNTDLVALSKYPSLCIEDNQTENLTHDGVRYMNRRWDTIHSFFDLPYWSRVWVFQEVVLARRLVFAGPSNSLSFEAATRATEILSDISHCILALNGSDSRHSRPD